MERYYFETSAVNYLYDNIFTKTDAGSLATRELQASKGRQWCISQLVLWEIFMTSNKARRDELFDFSRCLFHNKLLSSPEELIINYIETGCQKFEPSYDIVSKSLLSKEWEKACNERQFYFELEQIELKDRTKNFHEVNKSIIKLFTNNNNRINSKMTSNTEKTTKDFIPDFLSYMKNEVCKYYGINDEHSQTEFYEVSLALTVTLLCYGIGIDHFTIEKYWNQKKINNPLERLEYVVRNMPQILSRGPIANMTRMYLTQSGHKSRGIYMDSLHSIYFTYADMFISGDNHFKLMTQGGFNDINHNKFMAVEKMNFFIP